MKKVKISIPEEDFGTLNTKYPADSSKVSNDSFTAGTKNIETSVKGVITKRKGGVTYSTLPTPPRDQYEAIFSDGVRHLLTVDNGNLRYTSGDGNETLVLAGLTPTLNFEFATTQDKVYFGNGIQKKVYDKVTSYGGVAYTFPTQTTKNMGAQAPSSALSGVGAGSGSGVAAGSYKYKVTFVYYDSTESNGGPESAVVTIGAPEDISLSSIPVGGYGVTQRKIYRASSTDSYTQYLLVAVVNNNTAVIATDATGTGLTPLPIDQGTPPDFTLISLYLDRLFLAGVAGDPYFIFYSEVGLPDVYPALNYIPCNQEDPITGIVVYLDRLIVFNRRSMGQILGKTSDQFRYAPIQGSIGCVDNRTIQTRVIDGVPVLVWLSDKGFYAYNGNSIVYISDVIEDQVNSNIQQSVIQKNRISHSDYAIFTAGTSSDGINLEANQGTITTKGPYWDTGVHPLATYEDQTNPKKIFDTEDEWEDGTTQSNIVTSSDGLVKVPIQNQYNVADGSGTNIVLADPNISLAINTYDADINNGTVPYTGSRGELFASSSVSPKSWGQRFEIIRSGTLTSANALSPRHTSTLNYPSGVTLRVSIYNEVGGSPSGELYGSNFTYTSIPPSGFNMTISPNLNLSTGFYWLVVTAITDVGTNFFPLVLTGSVPYWSSTLKTKTATGSWVLPSALGVHGQIKAGTSIGSYPNSLPYSITFIQTAVPVTGQWISAIHDTETTNLTSTVSIAHAGLFQSGTFLSGSASGTSITTLQASDDPLFVVGVISELVNNLNGSYNTALSNKRYWRVVINLSTPDNRVGVTVTAPLIKFSTMGTWESEVLDCTSDVSVYQNLTTISTLPSGTSVTTKIATSTVPTGPWTFVTFGSHTVRQYAKLQLVLTTDSGNTVTPSVSSLLFSWSTVATFISDEIDIGTTPAGWDIFQASFSTNSGTVVFSMRSAATSGALSGATWYTVTNGEFPTSSLPTLQWVQWRAVITSTPDQVPTIDSVTIGWFVGTATQGIRAASIFYDKNYYVSLSEFENDYNNIVFVLDFEGKWRVFRDLNIATLSYFFNNPYFGDAVSGNIVKFLEGTSDEGDPIELDVYTKAFDGSSQYTDNEDKVKVLDHVIIDCANTGATFDCSYSVDGGETFNLLYDTSGNNSWVTGTVPFKYLRPRYVTTIPQGYSLMIRIHNNDTNEVEINSMKAVAFVREQPPIITG